MKQNTIMIGNKYVLDVRVISWKLLFEDQKIQKFVLDYFPNVLNLFLVAMEDL